MCRISSLDDGKGKVRFTSSSAQLHSPRRLPGPHPHLRIPAELITKGLALVSLPACRQETTWPSQVRARDPTPGRSEHPSPAGSKKPSPPSLTHHPSTTAARCPENSVVLLLHNDLGLVACSGHESITAHDP